MRLWLVAFCVAGLAACATDKDGARYQFGVSADRPAPAATGSPATVALLDWKATQICTLGYRVVRQDTMNAEGGVTRIVDNHIHCNDYHPSIDLPGMAWLTIY